MTDDTTEPGPETTPVIGANDGALPPEPATPVPHSAYDAALAAGNAPDQMQPSGGDTVIDDVGNEPGPGASVSDASTGDNSGSVMAVEPDPGEAAYETARLAAVANGDTSWPTWGFLSLDEKLTYLPEA